MKHKTFVVVNPRSGRAKIKNRLLEVVQELSLAGHSVTVYPTKFRGDATDAVALLDDSFDTVVCCGGDGTLNEVITGLMNNKNHYNLGYVPAGTLNEWSTGLKFSKDAKKAAEDVTKYNVMPLDIGKFGDRYFTYTASFGAFTEASYAASQDIKNVLGQAAYLFEGIKSVGNIKPIHLKFICDGKEIEDDFVFGSISNSMSVGGVVKFDQTEVRLNDGLFEVMLIHAPTTISDLNNILDGILKKDLNRKCIQFLHAKNIEIIGAENVNFTLDGELAEGSNRIDVINLHSEVSFIVPEKTLIASKNRLGE
jgi:YegS/Rv2252/BmrU family lipid kinase